MRQRESKWVLEIWMTRIIFPESGGATLAPAGFWFAELAFALVDGVCFRKWGKAA